MPMIHDCYLAGVDSTYNPDSNAFFIDGQPTAIELSLSFQEAKQLTRHDLYVESTSGSDPSYDYSRPGSFEAEASGGKSEPTASGGAKGMTERVKKEELGKDELSYIHNFKSN